MTLDGKARAMTLVACALLPLSLGIVVVTGAKAGLVAFALLAVVLMLAWAMSPSGVVVYAGVLRIERRAWRPLRIPLASVASASRLDGLGAGTTRVFGVGGFFGSYGLFSNGELGRFRMYATRSGQAVIVRRTGGELPLVLTPEDVPGAIEAIGGRPRLTE